MPDGRWRESQRSRFGQYNSGKGKFSFSGVHQMPDIAIIKDMDGETYPLIFEKEKYQ